MTEKVCFVCSKNIDDSTIFIYTLCCKKYTHLECQLPNKSKKYSYKNNKKMDKHEDPDPTKYKCDICGKETIVNKLENANDIEQSDVPPQPLQIYSFHNNHKIFIFQFSHYIIKIIISINKFQTYWI